MEKTSVFTDAPNKAKDAANKAIDNRFAINFEASRIEFATDGTLLTVAIKWRKSANPAHRTITATTDKEAWDGLAPLNHPVLYVAGMRWFLGIN